MYQHVRFIQHTMILGIRPSLLDVLIGERWGSILLHDITHYEWCSVGDWELLT